jgi:hypothetical protein
MHSQLFTNDPRVSGWAYGFWEMELNNQSIIGHGGDTILFHTLLQLIPKDNLGIFISMNELASEPASVELLQAFMDHYYPVLPASVRTAIPEFEKNASRFTGSYRSARSAYSNFEKVSSLFGQVQVYPGPNNTLITSHPAWGQQQWVEVAPLSFRPADGVPSPSLFSDGLVFGEDGQGDISHLFYLNNPTTAYEKVAWYDGTNFNYVLLGSCIILFLSTLLWPMGSLFNRCRGKTEGPARAARWLAGGASILNLLFLTGLVAMSAIASMSLIYSTPAYLIALAMVAIIAAMMAVVAVAFAASAWRKGYWSIAGRLHYTLVVAAGLAFIWWLQNWNLLGFKF